MRFELAGSDGEAVVYRVFFDDVLVGYVRGLNDIWQSTRMVSQESWSRPFPSRSRAGQNLRPGRVNLIGLSGKIGSGKNFFAETLQWLDRDWQIKAYADKLKEICSLLTGVPLELQYSREGKARFLDGWNMTVGQLQQRLGTEGIRNNVHSQAWVMALFADWTPDQKWVVVDMRFPNEAVEVRRLGGLLVRIDGVRQVDYSRDLNHPSETALDCWQDWDYRFDNSAEACPTVADMVRHVESVRSLLERR